MNTYKDPLYETLKNHDIAFTMFYFTFWRTPVAALWIEITTLLISYGSKHYLV